ncbi:hypothetical protein F2Q70_00006992 [Brassica cretica]|uniref:Uncharacterized protein n=1 Tax=Brassica cretica TaxID=69181 RepID=A0A8S9M2F3_BRACR|nr:hypothetical protein F2Q70_00006992 [Brassica cretica]
MVKDSNTTVASYVARGRLFRCRTGTGNVSGTGTSRGQHWYGLGTVREHSYESSSLSTKRWRPYPCFDMREICVLWNVEECPNWDKRFQGAVNAFLAYTDTQPSPELMDGMPTFLTKGDKDTIANTIVHHILIWARKNPEPSVSTLMLISDNLSEETLTACLALKVRDGSYASDSASLLLATSWELENRKWTILTSELIRLKALLEETISNKEREILVLKREVKELEMIAERLKADEPFVTVVILDLENNLSHPKNDLHILFFGVNVKIHTKAFQVFYRIVAQATYLKKQQRGYRERRHRLKEITQETAASCRDR